MAWTPQQLDAIEAKNRSVIVSAAAGSGKTTVLIEKLIRILSDTENQVNVEDMVVVTFTNAAAAEMKQRLNAALTKKMEENPSDRWLSRQQAHLGMASISTIHSFCFNLIRDNAVKLLLSADFRIADEMESSVFSETVLKELIDEYYEKKPDEMKLLCDNFCGNNDSAIVRLILSLYTNISAMPFYEKKIKEFISLYDGDYYKKEFLENIGNRIYSCVEEYKSLLKTAVNRGEQPITELLDEDIAIASKVSELYNNNEFSEMFDFLEKVKFKSFPRVKKDTVDLEEREFINSKRNEIKDKFKNKKKGIVIYKSYYENADDDCRRHKEIMNVLFEFICEYDKRLFEYKCEKNAISFDDAEKITLKLLGECDENGNITKTDLAHELSEKYALIMVDEYQDSNDRQDMIFRLLSKGGNARQYGSNLFFVGDVKQSIYRFRLANPDNFLNVINSFKPYKKNENHNAFIKLNSNFRSSNKVIEFVNYIFRNIMSEKAGDINYNEDEYLIYGYENDQDRKKSDSLKQLDTHILLVDKTDEDKAEKNIEAVCIAKKIRQMIDEKVQVSNKDGSLRNCSMKDFCILMRNKSLNDVYAQTLRDYNLEVNCEDVSGYLKSREITVLLNVLKVIDNPLLDIPLASVMMSPMFMFNSDEIAQVRLVDTKTKLYNNVLSIINEEKTPSFDKESIIYKKCQNLYSFVTEIRLISAYYTLSELIQIIYDRTDFMSVIQLYKDADRKRANLRVLLEYANGYESVSGGGISGFIRYIDRISESKGDFKSVGGGSVTQDTVSIKTMHKSKGLEFPFVFIAQSDTRFSKQDDLKSYQFSADKGIGFKLQNKEKYEKFKTIPFEVINKYNKTKALGEEMRLLYVALTRAKEKLFITMDISETVKNKVQEYSADIYKNKGIMPSLVLSANSMSDWLYMNLIAHSKSAKLREIFEIYESFRYDDDFSIVYENTAEDDTEYEFLKEDIEEACALDVAIEQSTVEMLYDSFNFKYDDIHVNTISKLSVSDISKNDSTQILLLSRPKLAEENSELTGAEKGTALHSFLQFADFNILEKDFESEKVRMIENGYINLKQAEAVKKHDIDAFLNSGLYREIKKAEKINRERKFLISIDDLEIEDEFSEEYKGTDGMLNGIMDMVIENDDHVILVDYKTDKIDDLSVLVKRYKKQLLLYKKALEKIQDKPVKSAIIYSFCKQKEVKVF